mmetsp:Transcript_74608/g.109411  ORF Transcript_74608/g.109411 Transcript_74608/m.109411 type:complete len:99 (-) Transcript_74608:137-433(-)
MPEHVVDLQLVSPVQSPSRASSAGLDFFNNGPSSPQDLVPLVSLRAQIGPQTLGAPHDVHPEFALPAKTGIKVLRWEEALLSGIMRDAVLYAHPIDAR